MTELLPLKAKRRIWSLRRRGTPFSPIFRRATKDGATGGRRLSSEVGKNVKHKKQPPEVVGPAEHQLKTYTQTIPRQKRTPSGAFT